MQNTKSLTIAVVLSAAGMLLAPVVSAQDVDNRASIYAGFNRYIFDGDSQLKNDWGWLVGGEIPIAQRWSANLERYDVDTDNKTRPALDSGLTLTRLGVNYLFDKSGNWQPYAGVGLGHYRADGAFAGTNFKDTSWDFGAGLKYFVNDNLFLRGEGRLINNHESNLQDFAVSLAIGYAFGGTTSAPVAATPPPAVAKAPVDSDGDGVYDNMDACPNTPKGTRVDARGCELDSDRDTVVDSKDKCPDTPTTLAVDANGCPITETQVMRQTLLVNFDHDKSDVKPQYSGELEKFAQFMRQYPAVTAVIEGHTDSDGKDAYNQKLSERRATAVMNSLIRDHGIAANRLSAQGYGESKPVASNDTADGKQKNRRIEAAVSTQVQVQRKR